MNSYARKWRSFFTIFDFIFMLESGDPLLLGTIHAFLFAYDVIFLATMGQGL
jgi:hypothetical protein